MDSGRPTRETHRCARKVPLRSLTDDSRELETTGLAQHAAWQVKAWPPVEKVRPDVWSVPIPIPDNPIRYTLCYLLFGADELVVVDPGWDTDDGWTRLNDGLAVAGTSLSSVTGIVLTHVHPDHHGMTARLAGVHRRLDRHASRRAGFVAAARLCRWVCRGRRSDVDGQAGDACRRWPPSWS